MKLSQIMPVSGRYKQAFSLQRLPSVSRQTKEDVAAALDAAVKSGKFMVAVWSIENGRVYLSRHTHGFPVSAFGQSTSMITTQLAEGIPNEKAGKRKKRKR